MALYSVNFLELANKPAGTYEAGPAASGYVWVVRDISMAIAPADTLLTVLTGTRDAEGNSYWFSVYQVDTSTATTEYHWEGRQPLNPGEILVVSVSGGSINGRWSGYNLTTSG